MEITTITVPILRYELLDMMARRIGQEVKVTMTTGIIGFPTVKQRGDQWHIEISPNILQQLDNDNFSEVEFTKVKPLSEMNNILTDEQLKELTGIPQYAEIVKRTDRQSYLDIDYRWQHSNPELNIADGYHYTGTGIGYDGYKLTVKQFLLLEKWGFDVQDNICNRIFKIA